MKNLQKISLLAVCGLWVSTAADAMNANLISNNREASSSSVRLRILDQENIDSNVSRPAKKPKVIAYDGLNRNPLLNSPTTEIENIQKNPVNIVYHLAHKKKPFTRNDIRRTVEERISKDGIHYSASKIQEIGNKVVQTARHIGNNRNSDDLYWKPIKNYQNYESKFLYPVIYSSESNKWESAAKEWKVIYYGEDEGNTCICGKEEIKYISRIFNRFNGNELYPIGSRCINKFKSEEMNEDIHACEKAFNKTSNGISKLREILNKGESIKFNAKLFSKELILYLNNKKALDDYDRQFLLEMRKKERNSEQEEQINKIIKKSIVPYIQQLSRDEKIVIDKQMLEQLKQ